jgi:tellurite resistance protein TehA-like permease
MVTSREGERLGAFRRRLATGIANLYPGYFALVMATGIVSVAAHMLGMTAIALVLYLLTIVFALVLTLALVLRLVFYFERVLADLDTHTRGPGFFTLVAAICVVGVQLVLLQNAAIGAAILWFVAALLWLVLLYAFFSAIIVLDPKPDLGHGLTGAWLIVVVSTESLSLLATLVASRLPGNHELWLFGALAAFLLGAVLFIFITALIFYRFTFFAIGPQDLSPLYWVNMGAAAITSLAGAVLVLNDKHWPFLQALVPSLLLGALAYWVAGSWWIPLLIILGIWRHVIKRYPFTYSPRYWGIVFPLGMYTAATLQLAHATGLGFLVNISRYSIYVALAAWLITAIAMARRIVTELILGSTPTRPGQAPPRHPMRHRPADSQRHGRAR